MQSMAIFRVTNELHMLWGYFALGYTFCLLRNNNPNSLFVIACTQACTAYHRKKIIEKQNEKWRKKFSFKIQIMFANKSERKSITTNARLTMNCSDPWTLVGAVLCILFSKLFLSSSEGCALLLSLINR